MTISDIIEQFPGVFYVMNTRLQYISSNSYTANLFGFASVADMLGKVVSDMNCPAVACSTEFIYQDTLVLSTQQEMTFLDMHTYNAEYETVLITKKKPWYEEGRLAGIINCGTPIQSSMIRSVIKAFAQSDTQYFPTGRATERSYIVGNSHLNVKLTHREMECLFYLLRGKSHHSIADALNLSINTINSHLKNIKRKCHCHTREELIEYAIKNDLHQYLPQRIFLRNISYLI